MIKIFSQPLYGGKRHRVTTDIRRVGEKKPILKLEGEWNGVLYTKLPNKVALYFYLMHTIYYNIMVQAHEVFVDTTKLPLVKKKIKKLEAQESNESRRLAMVAISCIMKYCIAKKFGDFAMICKLEPSKFFFLATFPCQCS